MSVETKSSGVRIGVVVARWLFPMLMVVAFAALTVLLWPAPKPPGGLAPRASFTLPLGRIVLSSVAFAPEGRTLATGAGDGSVRLVKLDDGSIVATLRPKVGPEGYTDHQPSTLFSNDGRTLVTADVRPANYPFQSKVAAPTVSVWRVPSGDLAASFPCAERGYPLEIVDGGRTVAMFGAEKSGTERLLFKDLADGRTVLERELPDALVKGEIDRFALSKDGGTVAVAGVFAPQIAVVDVRGGSVVRTFPGHRPNVFFSEPRHLALNHDGSILAVDWGDAVEVFDVRNGTRLWRSTYTDEMWNASLMKFSADGRRLLIAGHTFQMGLVTELIRRPLGIRPYDNQSARLRVHDVATGRKLRTVLRDHFAMSDAAISADGKSLAAVGFNNPGPVAAELVLWDLPDDPSDLR